VRELLQADSGLHLEDGSPDLQLAKQARLDCPPHGGGDAAWVAL
jgi:hypothetical protein